MTLNEETEALGANLKLLNHRLANLNRTLEPLASANLRNNKVFAFFVDQIAQTQRTVQEIQELLETDEYISVTINEFYREHSKEVVL